MCVPSGMKSAALGDGFLVGGTPLGEQIAQSDGIGGACAHRCAGDAAAVLLPALMPPRAVRAGAADAFKHTEEGADVELPPADGGAALARREVYMLICDAVRALPGGFGGSGGMTAEQCTQAAAYLFRALSSIHTASACIAICQWERTGNEGMGPPCLSGLMPARAGMNTKAKETKAGGRHAFQASCRHVPA